MGVCPGSGRRVSSPCTSWSLASWRCVSLAQRPMGEVMAEASALERARSALSFLSPDCDRETWVKWAMCIKHEFGDEGFVIWDEWSAGASGSYNAMAARSTWKSVKADGKLTFATLIYNAKQAGWKDDSKRKKPTAEEIAARKKAYEAREQQAREQQAAVHEQMSARAVAIWNDANPCDGASHPYLVKKGVASHGLRVGRWEVLDEQTGEWVTSTSKALLIPIMDRKRRIWSLQAIYPSGDHRKLYLRDAAKNGNFFAIGTPKSVEGRLVFLLGEGYATCASAHEATGHMVLVCFDVQGLRTVARELRATRPDAAIILLADNDTETEASSGKNPGLAMCTELSKELGAFVAVPPPGDFNDLHLSRGLCAVDAAIKAVSCARSDSDEPLFKSIESVRECAHLSQAVSQDKDSALESPIHTYDTTMSLVLEDDFVDPLLLTQPLTQDRVALAFRDEFDGRLLFAHSFGCWLKWDGARWCREKTMLAFDFVRLLARGLNVDGKNAPSSSNFCKGVETFARADRSFAVEGSEFDVDNYLLNTPIGTFDLRTNQLRPHDPLDRIMKSTAVSPCSEGGSLFLKFLGEITGDDESMAFFLQVTLGACLSGAIESHWMMFWTGAGRNGKNTLGDLVMDVMGDYAKKVPSSTLMSKQHEDHPTEIANLQGARLVVSSEVEDGAHWNESRINELTGDQTLTARFMRGDFFDFKRTHKHLIYGNHRPQLRTATDALKARIKIVHFKQSFIGREDADLPTKLRKEAGFVLFWLMEGHAAWLAAGRKLPACEAIEAESRDYFESQSTVEAWVRERVTKVNDDGRGLRLWPKSADLYKDYKSWKDSRGEQPVSQSRWGETMAKLFTKRTSDGVRYVGACLLPI